LLRLPCCVVLDDELHFAGDPDLGALRAADEPCLQRVERDLAVAGNLRQHVGLTAGGGDPAGPHQCAPAAPVTDPAPLSPRRLARCDGRSARWPSPMMGRCTICSRACAVVRANPARTTMASRRISRSSTRFSPVSPLVRRASWKTILSWASRMPYCARRRCF